MMKMPIWPQFGSKFGSNPTGDQRIKGCRMVQDHPKTVVKTVQHLQLVTNAKVSINHKDQLGPSHRDILRMFKTYSY